MDFIYQIVASILKEDDETIPVDHDGGSGSGTGGCVVL
jgi:hypothetical protein